MNKKPKTQVAFLLDASSWGGIEQHVASLVQALDNSGCVKAHLILWRDYGDSALLNRFQKESGVDVYFCSGSYFNLMKLMRNLQVSCVHTHGYKMNLIGRWLKCTSSLRVISTHHNGDVGEGRVRLYTLLDQLTAGLVENCSVSRPIQKRLLPVKSTLVRNFIRLPPAADKSCNTRVLYVGRLQPVKRPDRFIVLARRMPQFDFHVFGEGPLRKALEHHAPNNLTWHGYQQMPDIVWNHGDVCIICSDDEGLPLTALEAMARGIPIIASPVGELPALINHGENGWIVESLDLMEKTLRQWRQSSHAHRTKVRRNARATIERSYSVGSCLSQYLNLYQAVSSKTKSEWL